MCERAVPEVARGNAIMLPVKALGLTVAMLVVWLALVGIALT